ncbi:MAG: hypothetical protein R6T98_01295 [Desulfatiglandales bacterium]
MQRFCAEGIFVNMLRSKIVKRSLQQGFSRRSRWLLHNLGSIPATPHVDFSVISQRDSTINHPVEEARPGY